MLFFEYNSTENSKIIKINKIRCADIPEMNQIQK